MEIDIKEQVENPLLNRTEIHFDCIYQEKPLQRYWKLKPTSCTVER